MFLQSTKVIVNKDDIIIKMGDDKVVYSTDINSFEKNSGVTIHNVVLSELEAYYLDLSLISENFGCGNIFDNLSLEIEKEYKNELIIIDFESVEEATDSFFESYTKFLLKTSNKIITINMNTNLTNQFGYLINEKINKKDDTEEEE